MCLLLFCLLLFIAVKEEAEANYEVSFKVRYRDFNCCFEMSVVVVVYYTVTCIVFVVYRNVYECCCWSFSVTIG